MLHYIRMCVKSNSIVAEIWKTATNDEKSAFD